MEFSANQLLAQWPKKPTGRSSSLYRIQPAIPKPNLQTSSPGRKVELWLPPDHLFRRLHIMAKPLRSLNATTCSFFRRLASEWLVLARAESPTKCCSPRPKPLGIIHRHCKILPALSCRE